MDIPALAEKIRQEYAEMQAELDKFFEGVSEEQAAFKPAPDAWSAKEVLAHLIQSERFQQSFAAELVNGYERQADGFGRNLDATIQATTSAYPTLEELLDGFKRSCAETCALFANLPGEFLDRKGSFWRLALAGLEWPYHFDAHIEQMRASIEGAEA